MLVPPRSFSDETLLPTTEWVKVGPGGRIEAFTMVYEKFNNLPEPPYAFGYVLLDGADTALGGYFKGIDLTDPHAAAEKLKIGTRVVTTTSPRTQGRDAGLLVRARGAAVLAAPVMRGAKRRRKPHRQSARGV